MPSRALMLDIGKKEVGVSVKTNAKRILEYFASYKNIGTKTPQQALQISWCQLFANWLLDQGGYPEMPRKDDAMKNPTNDSVRYSKRDKSYKPKPGDLYYAELVAGKRTDHMGFFVEDLGNGFFKSLDGNAGQIGHMLYDATIWTNGQFGKLTGGMGGGVVCNNIRKDDGGPNIKLSFWVELPLMIDTTNPYE